MASRTTPVETRKVPGYPDTLVLYKIPASPFWQVRYFVGGKHIRRSTRCEDLSGATSFAKDFFKELATQKTAFGKPSSISFSSCAADMLKRQQSLIQRGERDERINSEDRKKLDADIIPWFGARAISDITTSDIDEYIDEISRRRRLSPSTLHKHTVVIRKVLKEAARNGQISAVPIIPTIRLKDNPRPYFTAEEYRTLHRCARRLAKCGLRVRGVLLDDDIADFIVFHVNVFVRISDIKTLKHRQIQVINNKSAKYIAIMPARSKTVQRESVSLQAAVDVYTRLIARHRACGFGKRDDYVFFPALSNRQYALDTIRRQFEYVLNDCDLTNDSRGVKRTLYSLRHTALMLRFLNGSNIDVHLLAKNALTSVDQLERFYLSHAESRMKISELQSMKAN